jgi:hypothetical protein
MFVNVSTSTFTQEIDLYETEFYRPAILKMIIVGEWNGLGCGDFFVHTLLGGNVPPRKGE